MSILHRFLPLLTLVSFLCPARAQSPFGHALALDGVSQYVAVPTAAASGISNTFTIEAWVNLQAYNAESRLMDFGNGPAADNIVCALSAGTTGQPNFSFYLLPANQSLTAPNPLPLNAWTHVAFAYDGTNGSIFVNGALAARGPMLPPPSVTRTNNYIGRSNWASDGYTQAVLDEFRIWKVARTQAQIQSLLNAPLRGNEAGLLLYYRLDSTNGVVATNSATATGSAFNGTLVNGPTWANSGVPIVSTTADSGVGSLRQVIASAPAGAFITFASKLSGQTIRLTSGEILLTNNVTIDGSPLAKRIQLNGNHTNRIFQVNDLTTVTLNSLVLTNGFGNPAGVAGTNAEGGAVLNFGTLAINNCALANNSAANGGGAIENYGPLTLTACTLANNSAANGGAIDNRSTCALYNCTFFGNLAKYDGGAINNESSPATLSMLNCTILGNSAKHGGGGIAAYTSSVNLTNSIIAGNTDDDVYNANGGTLTAGGANIVQSIVNFGTLLGADTILAVNPGLAPLGNNGGPTQTMPPLPGSPAIDNGDDSATNSLATDQRGQPRLFGLHVDIGAVESVYKSAPPTVVTLPALDRMTTSAVLNGTVTPNGGVPTAYYFQYGPTINYAFATGTNVLGDVLVSAAISNLSPSTFYHSRLVATNALGRTFGKDIIFHTGSLTSLVTNAKDDGSAGSLRALVDNAALGDTIRFATSLSGQAIRLTSGPILVDNDLTIDASVLAKSIFINGNSKSCIFQVVSNVTVVLNSLVITNGYNFESDLPSSGKGGGIHNEGILAVNNCIVAGNGSDADAGGIYNLGTITISNCTLAANYTYSDDLGGGGIHNDGTMTMNNTTLSGNTARGGCGGGLVNLGALTVNNSTFTMNRIPQNGIGGGIYNQGALTANNVTVVNNSAGNGSQGGGIFNTQTLNLVNSIVAGNSASVSPDLSGSFSGGNNLIGLDPMLAPLGNYGGPTQTMPPLPGSPAIDAGDDSVTSFLTTDQRGQPRVIGAHVDIGAVEANPLMLIVQIAGAGKVVPNYNGQMLTLGNTYTMTATASPTFTFTNWTGGTNLPLAPLTNRAVLKFVMQPNLVLQANFLDRVKPTLLITNLAAGRHVSNQLFIVKGWARDNAGVSNVLYRLTNDLSDTGWLPATSPNNFTNWSASLTLQPGTNTISAYAIDTSGSLSATNTIKFVATFSAPPPASSVADGAAVPLKPQVVTLAPVSITGAAKPGNGPFEFTFTGPPGGNYLVFATTDLGLPFSDWTPLGSAVESPPGSGQYRFIDSQIDMGQRFYRVTYPSGAR
jgi:hypothetical protein